MEVEAVIEVRIREKRVSKRRYQLTFHILPRGQGDWRWKKCPLTRAIRMSQVTYESSFAGEEVKEGEGEGLGADV